MTVAAEQNVRGIAQTNGATLWLTERELGEAGYREVTMHGKRVGQFALCRDWRGERVYPEFRLPDETAQDVAERNRRDRARCGGKE